MRGEEEADFERLIGNIREELQAQNALRNIRLSQELIGELAECIASNLDYAFEVKWAPRWEGRRRSLDSD